MITSALIRAATVAVLSNFLIRAVTVWQQQPSLPLALLIVGEVITAVIFLTARSSRETAFDVISLLSTGAATFYLLFVGLASGKPLAPDWVSSSVQAVGIAWQIASKISLGRSFGLLPANRGIVTHGPYRCVRHPIYLGYFVAHIGFLLSSYTAGNCALFAVLYFFQGVRIWREEQLLLRDETYQQYARIVPYRVLPGLM